MCIRDREGAKVVVLDRSEEAGKALVDSIKAEGNEAMFLYTDVMDKEVLEGNKVEIMKAYGRIDVLLNAAGGNMAGATIAPDKTCLLYTSCLYAAAGISHVLFA